ncbi:unnamed protein product [Bursaphelenchus okinawaensis]|uniref:Ig-like domain-containing protein n=1 Tax=Bursaphelenchus okinawaensis TaxID=465554 RepID=A0A811JRH5_9BILA|nr:unnamed protein product [Bursaphelenchus okinawaensis]CAG9080197.1 unnamed protein product [Bursaphelenchus okinawaensis]
MNLRFFLLITAFIATTTSSILSLNHRENFLCPKNCECHEDTKKIDCQRQGIGYFPTDLPRDVKVLDLRYNSIRRLSRSDLRGLDHLETLLLGNNQITHLDEDILDFVPSLRRLYIGRNQLRNLPRLTSHQFGALLVIDVHGNKLHHISKEAFRGLIGLERVHIGHNYIQYVDFDRIFKSCENLKILHLSQNPWNCDCRARTNAQYLKHQSDDIEGDSPAKCYNPPEMRGATLRELSDQQLKCFEVAATKVGDGFIVDCDATEKSTKTHYLYNGHHLDIKAVGAFELLPNGSLAIYQPDFHFYRLECALDYPVGVSRQPRHLTDHARQKYGKPRFTYQSFQKRSFREGSTASLSCEVNPETPAQVYWTFNGKRLTPSRKHQINNNGQSLDVYPFLEHDVGEYECTAYNNYGSVSHRGRVGIISSSPPVIHTGPANQKARPGQTVRLNCEATGNPKPKITWSFEGSDIPLFKGHYQTNPEGTQLTITAVGRADHGTYTCMAGNAVGSMTASAKLTIEWSQLDYVDKTIDQTLLETVVATAKSNIQEAEEKTKSDLRSTINDPKQLMRHFTFAIKRPVELTRAREVYEQSLRLIEKHIEQGLHFKPTDIPTNVSYESVLSVTHIQTLMELSGCMNGQFQDACEDMCFHSKYRSYTGQCNNFEHPTWGVSQMPFRRLLQPMYENGFNTPIGWDPHKLYFGYKKPNARSVSQHLVKAEQVDSHSLYTGMLMQWGQFLDHDITFKAPALARQTYSGGAICNRTCENIDPCFNIPLPEDDPRRKTEKFPCIEVERSAAICGSGETSPIFRQVTFREQTNTITSYIDASNVYGSTEVDALDLRDLFGDHGLLRFDIVSNSQKPYMPFEKDSAMECRRNTSRDNPIRCFLAGDGRANEQIALTSMHTVWFREHNRIAGELLEMNPDWNGERIYHEARKIIGAMMQHITYEHWLPKVLGMDGYKRYIGPYMGYKPDVDPQVTNEFATAAFRFGHTIINPIFSRLDTEFKTIKEGDLPLPEAFFAPERLISQGGIDPLLRGLFATPMKRPSPSKLLTDALTERLFYRSENVSMDLAAINIQRGRDHGLRGYLEYREFCNLTVPKTWEDLMVDVKDEMVLEKLKTLYGHPGNIDLWVGGIIEKVVPGALVGPTFACIIGESFKAMRDGDRFWYENPGIFTQLQLQQLRKTTLAKVLCNNGDNITQVQRDVFKYMGMGTKFYGKCDDIPDVELKMWMSCCDEACQAREDPISESMRKSRKRRSRHLYGSSEELQTGAECEFDGVRKRDGSQWKPDQCTECECNRGKVWCHTDAQCLKKL